LTIREQPRDILAERSGVLDWCEQTIDVLLDNVWYSTRARRRNGFREEKRIE
jgi:hypothetical protein